MRAEIAMVQLQAKEHQGLPGATRGKEEVKKDSFLEPAEEHHLTDTLILDH